MCGHQKAASALDGEGLLRNAAQCSNSSIHGHTRMGVQSGQSIPAPARSQEAWSWSTTKAETNASSRHDSYRPEGPEWPDPRSVFRRIGRALSVAERSFATHLAGSQYGTRGSLKPAVASTAGYVVRWTLS